MRTLFLSVTALIFGGFLSSAMAFKPAPPRDLEVKSPNGKYTLKVIAETGVHQLCEGDKALWQFQQEVWHDEYFVADDGKHVLWVAWEYVQVHNAKKDEAVVVYSAEGKVVAKTYAQASEPRVYGKGDIGPVGDFWRIWRDAVIRVGEKVTIAVAGKEPLVIDLSNLSKIAK